MSNITTVISDNDDAYPKTPFVFRLGERYNDYFEAAKSSLSWNKDDVNIANSVINSEQQNFITKNPQGVNANPNDIISALRSEFPTSKNWITSTELGRNEAVNCRWGFCEDDDIIHPMLALGGNPDYGGLGRVYSETYNNTQQLLHITVGVPEFTSMADFYLSSIDPQAVNAINQGTTGLGSWLGGVLGSTITLAVDVVMMPIRFLRRVGTILDPTNVVTKYYDIQSAMPLYYRHVDSILAHLAVNMGLYPNTALGLYEKGGTGGTLESTQGSTASLKKVTTRDTTPDNWSSDNGNPNPIGSPNTEEVASKYIGKHRPPRILEDGLSIYKILSRRDRDESGNLLNREMGELDTSEYFIDVPKGDKSLWEKFREQTDIFQHRAKSSFSGADKYITFRIDKSTDSSESLSNSTGETAVSQFLNSATRAGKDTTMSFMGGNFADIPGIGDAVGLVTDTIKGAIQGFSITNLAQAILSGSVYMDIPEMWTASSFSKSYSFTTTLRAPYGDAVSIFQSEYVPLAMLMAMAFPRAGGKNAYGSPFLVRAYSRGMFAIPLGIIDSLSIRRGSPEFGWNMSRLPTTIEVSFSIKDLSNMMSIAAEGGFSNFLDIFGSNSSFQEYLMTLSGLGLQERLSLAKVISRRLAVSGAIGWSNKWGSVGAYLGTNMGDGLLGRIAFGLNPTTFFSSRSEGFSKN